MQAERRHSFHEIDYARMFFAIVILLGHCAIFGGGRGELFGDLSIYFNRWLGALVVPFFFAVSGFFLAYYLKDSKDLYSKGKKGIVKFIKQYCIWSLIYIPLHVVEYYKQVINGCTDIVTFIWNTVRQFLTGNFPLWWLEGAAIGIALYLLFHKMTRGNERVVVIIGFIIFLYASCFWYDNYFLKSGAFIYKPMELLKPLFGIDALVRNGVFFGFPFIALGALIAILLKQCMLPNLRMAIWGGIISGLLGLFEVRYAYILGNYDYAATANVLKIWLFPAVFFILIFLIRLSERTQIRNTKKIRLMSGMIYYTHWLVLYFMKYMMRFITGGWTVYSEFLTSILVLLVSLNISYVVLKIKKEM